MEKTDCNEKQIFKRQQVGAAVERTTPEVALAQAVKEQSAPEREPHAAEFATLAQALRLLDDVLAVAVDKQARLLGPTSLLDPWRGMHLDQSDIQRLLKAGSHTSLCSEFNASVPEILASALRGYPRAELLGKELHLTDADLAALLIVLAPDIDLRYERIYAYLQDDITRKRPTFDLIANLLARNPEERLAISMRFWSAAPLRNFGLLVAQGTTDRSQLGQPWRIDDLWFQWLIGDGDIDVDLASVMLVTPMIGGIEQVPIEPAVQERISRAIASRHEQTFPLRLLLQGPHGAGKYQVAQAVARMLGQKLLVLDVRASETLTDLRALLQRTNRAAILCNAMLYVHGITRLELRDPQMLRVLFEYLRQSACNAVVALATTLPSMAISDVPLVRVELSYPSVSMRYEIWRQALATRHLEVTDDCLKQITSRFTLNAPQIHQAVAEAQALAVATKSTQLDYADLAAAARLQCGTELARIAQRIEPRADFNALVVPAEVQTQLREICARVSTRDMVGREWASGSVHARATGLTALFVGPSGTGKTLSAEALAHELGLDLYRIDLAGIVSKYIGETEKNLDRVFTAAVHANAVLFFDEADALFGKRSEVKDAHDRYANIEVAYLLQKMEQFDGVAILATNLKQNLDDAFARRLTFTITFPFPEEPERRKLWEQLWPPRAPRHDDVDLDWFAREFRLSGGNIRNTVLAAAHLAAADGKVITREHLLHATRREYQKLGKNLVPPVVGDRQTR